MEFICILDGFIIELVLYTGKLILIKLDGEDGDSAQECYLKRYRDLE